MIYETHLAEVALGRNRGGDAFRPLSKQFKLAMEISLKGSLNKTVTFPRILLFNYLSVAVLNTANDQASAIYITIQSR